MLHCGSAWTFMGQMGLGWFFWGFVILLLVGVIFYWRHQHSQAEQILDERYARGELNEDEYLHRKKTLNKH
ncbi:hypothetical protein LFYK43_12350 [Ligilactobacillus salitolerans]|uniref:SHOCT domain-containing protein n=1 Tax=Ligilactobacillus salitolerans TaxID=1808352 RepID=A0A401ITC3_9LACO|nr:SHOCT domain-containing protein [Ligilactobacillus salitolerans]GBG94776.1 hypothetical protein LFYK43_12350 [Ligilactobacillus salitolerans]